MITLGMDPLFFKYYTSYDHTLFDNGSPFMGDMMDPFIQGD